MFVSGTVPSQGGIALVVFGGGIIPEADIEPLVRLGVAQVFTPGAPLDAIARWLEQALDARERGAA